MARDNILKVVILGDDKTKQAFQQATTAVAAFGATTAAALGVSAKQAADFEQGMAEIQTLLGGEAAAAVGTMRKELLDLSRQSGEALDSLTKARYDIISAGFSDSAESADVLGASLDLAKGGMVEVSQAADLLTTALNGLGISADESDRVANVLFSTVRLGKTTMGELSESMGQVFATARVANVSLEEVAAAMATITAAGIDTREAGTAVTQLLQALAAPGSEAAGALAELNITLDEGLGPALASLAEVSEGGLDALRALIPNIRALKAAAAAGSDIEKFNDNLAEVQENTTGLTEAVQIMEGTSSDQLRVLRQEFKVFAVEIGDALLPLLSALTATVRAFASGLNSMSDGMKETIAIGGVVVAVVTSLAAAFGGLTLAVSNAIPVLATLGVTLSAGPFIAAGIAVAAIGTALAGVTLAAGNTARNLKEAQQNAAAFNETANEVPRLVQVEVAEGVTVLRKETDAATRAFRNMGGEMDTLGIKAGSLADQFLQGGDVFPGSEEAGDAEDAAEAVDHLAEAFELVSQRTGTTLFQFRELLGQTPSDLELLRDALIDVGAPLEMIAEVTSQLGEGMTALLPTQEIERLGEAIEEMSDGLGEMPDFVPPRAPRQVSDMRILLLEMAEDFQIAAQTAFDETFVAFGDAVAATIIDGRKFGDVMAEGFKGIKRAIISATIELIAYRTVMKGLKFLSGVGGPLGAIAGFFLNTGTSWVPSPVKAQTGLATVPGTPGLDATPALLSGGETVLTRRSSDLLRRALRLPGERSGRMLDRYRNRGGGGSVVVGLEKGLLRTEAADISDRLRRLEKRRGGSA